MSFTSLSPSPITTAHPKSHHWPNWKHEFWCEVPKSFYFINMFKRVIRDLSLASGGLASISSKSECTYSVGVIRQSVMCVWMCVCTYAGSQNVLGDTPQMGRPPYLPLLQNHRVWEMLRTGVCWPCKQVEAEKETRWQLKASPPAEFFKHKKMCCLLPANDQSNSEITLGILGSRGYFWSIYLEFHFLY